MDIVPGRHIPEDSLPDPNPSAFDWGPSELVDHKEVGPGTSSVFAFVFVFVFVLVFIILGGKEGWDAWTGSSSDGLFLRRAGKLGHPRPLWVNF